ncbi:tyrosine-type recombinase/integrase [Mycobacterium nebraskense]|nr:tyrosine-type recombinase/integrase [Mycobacterium nebraskense]MCV7116117.1 tyrosine-type recombinase/integrase [Mycobacterium nebraskense]
MSMTLQSRCPCSLRITPIDPTLTFADPRVFNVARDSLQEFPKVTPHDPRHTAASLAVSAGGNVLALARMLGHEDPSLTLRTYADLFDSDLDALADVLDQHRAAAL